MPPIRKEKLYLSVKKLSLFVSKLFIKEDKKNNIDKEKADGRRKIPVKKDNLPKSLIKFSFPRKIIQGDIFDRDMHGAQLAVLLSEMKF